MIKFELLSKKLKKKERSPNLSDAQLNEIRKTGLKIVTLIGKTKLSEIEILFMLEGLHEAYRKNLQEDVQVTSRSRIMKSVLN